MSNITSIQPIHYQLLTTDTLTTLLPETYVYSDNEKNISVIAAHAFYVMTDNHGNKYYTKPDYWQLHSSFVQEGDYLNHYVCLFNQPLYHKRKYKQVNKAERFIIWITDYNGELIEPNENFHIIIEPLLQY